MRVVPYVRVSTEEQAKSGLGAEAQETAIRREAERRGLSIATPVKDEGLSGDLEADERPGLREALASLRRGDVLMVAKVDRLSRGDLGAFDRIAREVKRRGARIVSVAGEGTEPTGRYDTSAPLMLGMAQLISGHERRTIAARTHYALQAKRARGELAGHIPFGYRAVEIPGRTTKRGAPARRLEPVEEEQRTIAEIVALRGTGMGLRTICRRLEANGRRARGPRWHPETVRSILASVVTHTPEETASPTGQRATGDRETNPSSTPGGTRP